MCVTAHVHSPGPGTMHQRILNPTNATIYNQGWMKVCTLIVWKWKSIKNTNGKTPQRYSRSADVSQPSYWWKLSSTVQAVYVCLSSPLCFCSFFCLSHSSVWARRFLSFSSIWTLFRSASPTPSPWTHTHNGKSISLYITAISQRHVALKEQFIEKMCIFQTLKHVWWQMVASLGN